MADKSVQKYRKVGVKSEEDSAVLKHQIVFGVDSTNFYEDLSLNKLCLIEFSALFPQKQLFISMSFNSSVRFVVFYELIFGSKDLI